MCRQWEPYHSVFLQREIGNLFFCPFYTSVSLYPQTLQIHCKSKLLVPNNDITCQQTAQSLCDLSIREIDITTLPDPLNVIERDFSSVFAHCSGHASNDSFLSHSQFFPCILQHCGTMFYCFVEYFIDCFYIDAGNLLTLPEAKQTMAEQLREIGMTTRDVVDMCQSSRLYPIVLRHRLSDPSIG